jgi:serine/threonine protein kinase
MNIGERVGDYEIVRVLGAGGMGQVYQVRNVISERVEAMKILLPNMGSDPDLANRFLREIQVQAAMDHPNIARLYTAQQIGSQLVMFMEFVEGTSIEQLLESGPMGLGMAVNTALQVLDALAYAHAHGVVHRDIKPANIMRTPLGTVKLMDFGIARAKADRRLTQTGRTVGSLYYMSPEQIRGSEPDPRSDLYSVGISLYEMVTGKKPFQGDSDYSIMAAHLQETPVAPAEIVSSVPSGLSDIILAALAKDPTARFQNAGAFHKALSDFSKAMSDATQHVDTGSVAHLGVSTPPPLPDAPPPLPQAPATPPPPPSTPVAPSEPVYQAPSMPAPPPPTAGAPSAPGYQARAMPMSLPPPPVSGGSSRGGMVALAAFGVVAILGVAAWQGLKYMSRGEASQPAPAPPSVSGTPPVPVAQPAAPSGASDAASPRATPAGSTPPGGGAAGGLVPPSRPSASGQSPSGAIAPPGPVASRAQKAQTPKTTAIPQPVPAAPAAVTPVTRPAQASPPAVAEPSPSPARPSPAHAEPPRANAAQLNDLRKQYNLLAIRAGTVKSGLDSLKAQMARQGLGLRSDMVETENRMDYLMKEAMDSIRSGDAEGAKNNLDMAEQAVESLEKFLGR